MALEIERKFLVVDGGWRDAVLSRVHIVDHLIARFDSGKARIRFCDHSTIMTIKGLRRGLTRSEYHISLSEADARSMVEEFSDGPGLEKWRHEVNVHGLIWQVDEYMGVLTGLVTADVELPAENYHLVIPPWAGREITGDRKFGSGRLADAIAVGSAAAREIVSSCQGAGELADR